jgi:hypothetical protein
MLTPEEAQALGKALDAAKGYADEVLKGPLAELGGILSDTVGYWRLKNRVRLMLKAKQWLEERGVQPGKILPDVFVPLLEDGGNVEHETLGEMFASLLAGHLDPDRQETVHPSYTKVLAQFSPLDARFLVAFRNLVSDRVARESGLPGAAVSIKFIAESVGVSNRVATLSCLNLARLGIIQHLGFRAPENHPLSEFLQDSPQHQEYRMTEYGIAFCDACHYSDQSEEAPELAHNTAAPADQKAPLSGR